MPVRTRARIPGQARQKEISSFLNRQLPQSRLSLVPTTYTIDAGRYRVLFGGDTAVTDSFRALRSSRAFDLAIMPVGAYDPWIHYHCTPEQSWQMANDAGADFFLPVHHQTFALSREPYLEPIERIVGAAGREPGRIAVHRIGQEFHFGVQDNEVAVWTRNVSLADRIT